jgi:hypothetical protein
VTANKPTHAESLFYLRSVTINVPLCTATVLTSHAAISKRSDLSKIRLDKFIFWTTRKWKHLLNSWLRTQPKTYLFSSGITKLVERRITCTENGEDHVEKLHTFLRMRVLAYCRYLLTDIRECGRCMNEYGALVEWYWQGKLKYWEEHLSQCHSVHHKSHKEWPAPDVRKWSLWKAKI